MAVIETTTFRLAAGAPEAAFLEADRRVQTEFIPNHPGFLRRTTARGDGGEWAVVTLWASAHDADASAARAQKDPVVDAFVAMLQTESVETRRYTTLD